MSEPTNGNGKAIGSVADAAVRGLTLLSLVILLITLATQPLDSRDDVRSLQSDISKIETQIEANKEKLKEVETQFTYGDRYI